MAFSSNVPFPTPPPRRKKRIHYNRSPLTIANPKPVAFDQTLTFDNPESASTSISDLNLMSDTKQTSMNITLKEPDPSLNISEGGAMATPHEIAESVPSSTPMSHRRLTLDISPSPNGSHGDEKRPKSAEVRRGSGVQSGEFLLQKAKEPRRNSIGGTIVSMLTEIKPLSLSEMMTEMQKRGSKKRTRTKSNSLRDCEEVNKEEGVVETTSAAGVEDISGSNAVQIQNEETSTSTSTPSINIVEPPDTDNASESKKEAKTKDVRKKEFKEDYKRKKGKELDTIQKESILKCMEWETEPIVVKNEPVHVAVKAEPIPILLPVKTEPILLPVRTEPIIIPPLKAELPEPEEGACCAASFQQPTHVKLPDIKDVEKEFGEEDIKAKTQKLIVAFDDMDGHSKTSVYVTPTSVSPIVSSANIDERSVTNESLDIFDCGICTEPLSIPKSLPCLHNFCLQCLEKYFSANRIEDGQPFRCPTCRARAVVPDDGGAIRFPTNFHIENLRKRAKRKNKDVEAIVNDALAFLEQREIDIIETLTERKRCTLADMGQTRERFVTALENYLEEIQMQLEENYNENSSHIVSVIHKMHDKLEHLQKYMYITADDKESDAVDLLRRQGEVITNVARELEDIKVKVNTEVDKILCYRLKFELGDSGSVRFSTQLGKLVRARLDADGNEIVNKSESDADMMSRVKSWSMIIMGILPALVFCYLIKLIANVSTRK